MVNVQFFYRLDTLQIDAAFGGCKTSSAIFKDAQVYGEVNVEDPPYEVSRNHKVILDDEGLVINTEPSNNPVQPVPGPNPFADLLAALDTYGVHSYTPAQIDAFIDSVDNVPALRALLKTMAKCVVAFADYFQS